jgi:hypothetical protein
VRSYLEKPFTNIGLVEWLKVKALSSSPSTEKTKENSLVRGETPSVGEEKLRFLSESLDLSGLHFSHLFNPENFFETQGGREGGKSTFPHTSS